MNFNTYACKSVSTEMTSTMAILCFRVNRKMVPSSPTRPVAAVATAMLWGEIIFPVTPPLELAATMRLGSTPICCAVVFCREPNRALEDVSEPVRNTPSQPRIGEKNGNSAPVAVKASPKVELMAE